MKQNNYGELLFSENDICDLLMQGQDPTILDGMIVDHPIDLENALGVVLENIPKFIVYEPRNISESEFHSQQQSKWHMPDGYKNLDIAAYILGLCKSEAELQRCGHELLLYQERGLFDLLKYLKYLVDVMRDNQIIWGVGRGSSVASYVLYKLGVHRIDSMFYDLQPEEFLR
jgi:hypothetical protein